MSEDIFVPTSSAEDALVQPLHTVTYVTSDREGVDRLFSEGFELKSSGWIESQEIDSERLNPYFGFGDAERWAACSFHGCGDARNVQVRVLCVDESKPVVRPTVSGLYLGGLSIGFPMVDMEAREQRLADLGTKSSVGVKRMEFTSPSGEVYISAEIHFIGPENVFVLGVQRPDRFVPVGPLPQDQTLGGAAYSARCVDNPEAVIGFIEDVLGFETRRDATFPAEPPSGLRLESGTQERFVQCFAPGASSGYLVLLDHHEANQPSPAAYGPPNRGMAMWSLSTVNLDEVHKRAEEYESVRVLQSPAVMASPFLPKSRVLLLSDPGGFPIEIFEPI